MPTNRYGNKKPTKDGQSRTMRQRMAEQRRARGERGISSAPSEGRKVTSNNTGSNVNKLRNAARNTLKVIKGASAVSAVNAGPTAKGTYNPVTGQSTTKQGPKAPPKKVKYPTASETKAEERRRASSKDFDRSFAAARKGGKKTFSWRGKTYNTKLKK